MFYFHIATDIHDMIVDTNVDVLMLMETWPVPMVMRPTLLP